MVNAIHEPMAVPPLASRRRRASLASAREVVVATASGHVVGYAKQASWFPLTTAKRTPSGRQSIAAAAAALAAVRLTPFMEPEVSRMSISARSRSPGQTLPDRWPRTSLAR